MVRGRPANNEFWARFLRSYALDQQEPLTRHSACLARRSASTPSAHFQMTGFINTDLYDRSALVQMTGNYYGLDPAGRWRQTFSLSSAGISGALSLVSSLLIPTPRLDHDRCNTQV